MTSLLTFALSTASSFLTGAQEPSPGADLPAVGDSAPALEFDLVLGAGGVPTELDQEGKVVVVEFSTSWCAGCRAAVPHWNELAEELEGEDIVLVTVTNEDEAAAARFLADLSLKTPLAIDLDGSCFESFGVGGVPDAIVIDPEGRIAGFTHPRALTAKDLRRVAAGETVTFTHGLPRAERSWNHHLAIDEDVARNSFVLRPSAKPSGLVRMDEKSGVISFGGVPMSVMFSVVFECAPAELEFDSALPTKAMYELRALGSDGTVAGTRAMLRTRLPEELGVEVTRSTVEAATLVLRRAEGNPELPAAKSTGGGNAHPGAVQWGEATAPKLAALLGNVLHRTVLDQTGVEGTFAVDLKWDPEKGVGGLRAALGSMGLDLSEEKRSAPRYRLAPKQS